MEWGTKMGQYTVTSLSILQTSPRLNLHKWSYGKFDGLEAGWNAWNALIIKIIDQTFTSCRDEKTI